jgi:hypothetical protein
VVAINTLISVIIGTIIGIGINKLRNGKSNAETS